MERTRQLAIEKHTSEQRRVREREKREKRIMSNAMTGGSIISVHMSIDGASTNHLCTARAHIHTDHKSTYPCDGVCVYVDVDR